MTDFHTVAAAYARYTKALGKANEQNKAIRPEPWMGRAQKLEDLLALHLIAGSGGAHASPL